MTNTNHPQASLALLDENAPGAEEQEEELLAARERVTERIIDVVTVGGHRGLVDGWLRRIHGRLHARSQPAMYEKDGRMVPWRPEGQVHRSGHGG